MVLEQTTVALAAFQLFNKLRVFMKHYIQFIADITKPRYWNLSETEYIYLQAYVKY